MDRKITENDLLSYHYREADRELGDYINDHLSIHPEWREDLKLLAQIDDSLKQKAGKGPSLTTLRIIMEESQHQENPTY